MEIICDESRQAKDVWPTDKSQRVRGTKDANTMEDITHPQSLSVANLHREIELQSGSNVRSLILQGSLFFISKKWLSVCIHLR